MNPLINERHISFALSREQESNESGHTAIMMTDDNDTGGNTDSNSTSGFRIIINTLQKDCLFLVYLVFATTNVPSKTKLSRQNSAKLRKPSVRMKDRKSKSQ